MHDNKIYTLFIQELINSFCYFAPLTLLAVFLYTKGISIHETALAMLIGSVFSRWGRIIFAPCFDFVKTCYLMATMQAIGACGYFMLGYANSFSILLASITLIGLFYGNNSMLIRVLNSSLPKKSTISLNEKYAFIHVATNIASSVGPFLLNVVYYKINARASFTLIGIFLLIASIYSLTVMKESNIIKQSKWLPALLELLSNKNFFRIYCLIVLSWFFYAQIFSLAPVLVEAKFHLTKYIWIVAFTNGITVTLCSIKLNRIAAKIKNLYFPIFLNFIFSIVGFTCLSFINSILGVIIGVFFISLAEIMFIPGFQTILGTKVSEDKRVAIFAINALCVGIGEGLGYYYGTTVGFNYMIKSSISTVAIYLMLLCGLYLSLKLLWNNENDK